MNVDLGSSTSRHVESRVLRVLRSLVISCHMRTVTLWPSPTSRIFGVICKYAVKHAFKKHLSYIYMYICIDFCRFFRRSLWDGEEVGWGRLWCCVPAASHMLHSCTDTMFLKSWQHMTWISKCKTFYDLFILSFTVLHRFSLEINLLQKTLWKNRAHCLFQLSQRWPQGC